MKHTRFPILAAAVSVLMTTTAMAAAAPFDDLDNLGHPVMAFGHDPTELVLDPADVPVEALAIAAAAGNERAGILLADAPDAPVIILASAGQLSPKDDCHWNGKKGAERERHWHIDGTDEPGGPCLKDSNGETWHLNEHALCSDARIRFAVIEDLDWPTSHDWEEVARELRSCIMGLEPD
ncbi:MAG: hypothetical protein OXI83_01740 [Gemmatimonadota bacterium]|nr:hypothetical protein [Gemmatimonadota bacterium]